MTMQRRELCAAGEPGRFTVIEQAMGVPKGRVAAQRWLSGFVEEMKASGFVSEALRRHRIDGALVAPLRADRPSS